MPDASSQSSHARSRPRYLPRYPGAPVPACCQKCEILLHQPVRNRHALAIHVHGLLCYANIVVQTLAHLADAIESRQDGHHECNLRNLADLFLQLASEKKIELLVRATQLDVCLDSH